jgi:hypothetical protein
MSLPSDEFLADVAAVYIGDQANGSFGSGRLIAPGLIMTAGHVVDYPTREAPTRSGWKVCLLRNRTADGSWAASAAHKAEVIWRAPGDLDLALLQVADEPRLMPVLTPVFASYDLVGPIAEVDAAGFPEAWRDTTEAVRDYTVRGILRIASQFGPYAWSVPPADKPDNPLKWKGMSGAAACRIGPDGNSIYSARFKRCLPTFPAACLRSRGFLRGSTTQNSGATLRPRWVWSPASCPSSPHSKCCRARAQLGKLHSVVTLLHSIRAVASRRKRSMRKRS